MPEISSKAELRREAEKLASSYTDKQLFSSPYMQDILQGLVSSMGEQLGRVPMLTCVYDEQSDETAATDGKTITCNTMGPLIRGLDSTWKKYVCCIGHITHEMCHVLFTDFSSLNPLRKAWMSFSWYGDKPADSARLTDELKSRPMAASVWLASVLDMANIMEDVYIENRGYENFSGLCAAGLRLANDEKYRLSNTEKEIYSACCAGKLPLLTAFNMVLQMRKLGYEMKQGEPLNEAESACKAQVEAVLAEARPDIDALAFERDSSKRVRHMNNAAALMIRLMPKASEADQTEDEKADRASAENGGQSKPNQPENQKAGGSSSGGAQQSQSGQPEDQKKNEASSDRKGSGSSSSDAQQSEAQDISSAQAKQDLASAQRVAEKNGISSPLIMSADAVHQRPVDADNDQSGGTEQQTVEEARENAKRLTDSEESMRRLLHKAEKDVAEHEVEARSQSRRFSDMQRKADEMTQKAKASALFTGGYTVTKIRIIPPRSAEKRAYDLLYTSSMKRTAGNLARKISNLLKDRKTEGYDSGYLMGVKFNPADVYHGDGKYFSRQIVPDGQPDAAFGILVDESGSMYLNGKYRNARRTVMIIDQVLKSVSAPVLIAGHDACGGSCRIYPYVLFDRGEADSYTLANIDSRRSNADGCAVTWMSEQLLERPEKIKVLIVISDGLPTASSYYSKDPGEDTLLAIKKYRRKGIKIFGAILDDYDSISGLYGGEFSFDCRNEGALEKDLCKLVKRYVLAQ